MSVESSFCDIRSESATLSLYYDGKDVADGNNYESGHEDKKMAPQVGLEPTTLRLTAECSAIELLRNKPRNDVRDGSAVYSKCIFERQPPRSRQNSQNY